MTPQQNCILDNNLNFDKTLAYFIGVLQSDGSIYFYYNKKEKRTRIMLNLAVSEKSLPMLMAFQDGLSTKFNRKLEIRKNYRGYFEMKTTINRLFFIFKKWDNYQIDREIEEDPLLFGSYLAGLIDGDGYIKLKKNKDRRLGQLCVQISGPQKLVKIKEILERYTSAKVHFQKYKGKNCYDTVFYVTYKSIPFLKSFVIPNIKLKYKSDRLKWYILLYEPSGI